jgi:hypothetical protein
MPGTFSDPQCSFISQPILLWLEWLLSKPETEAAIDTWTRNLSHHQTELIDVQHGQNFQKLASTHTPTPLNLVLSLFEDWFNPRGNKINGKFESTGVFAFSCMNLPTLLQNKILYICLAALTPGPYSPDKITITTS